METLFCAIVIGLIVGFLDACFETISPTIVTFTEFRGLVNFIVTTCIIIPIVVVCVKSLLFPSAQWEVWAFPIMLLFSLIMNYLVKLTLNK